MLEILTRLVHRDLRKDEKGASAVEYGLLVAAIAAIIVVIVFALGKFVKSSFLSTCEEIKKGTASTATCS